ncbi:hypothetical protein Tco_1485126 [Tanacetum coccineum]
MTICTELHPVSGALSPVVEIDECHAYADALKDRRIDARVVVEAIDREESEMGARGPVKVRVERVMHLVMPDDIHEPAQSLRDNRRLRGTASVESQRVDQLQRGMSRMQRELRQIISWKMRDGEMEMEGMEEIEMGGEMEMEEMEEMETEEMEEMKMGNGGNGKLEGKRKWKGIGI